MIELKPCCNVPFPEKLFEQYETTESAIYANVNVSKVIDMMKHFIEIHKEPLFFILEIPSNKTDEDEIAPGIVRDLHTDVYYMDGLDQAQARQMLESVGHFLIKDGLNTFGFGGHRSKEEILFGKYNVMTIYAADPSKYETFFTDFEIQKTNKLVTAWDSFDKEHCGECELYESDGKTIYDIPVFFKDYGLYFAEKRGKYDQKHLNQITFEDLVGKIMLIGITYYTHDNQFIEQKQFWGTVIEANEKTIRIEQKNGEIYQLPPDLSSTQRASSGEYKLHSTGEVLIDPDFLTTWNVVKDEDA